MGAFAWRAQAVETSTVDDHHNLGRAGVVQQSVRWRIVQVAVVEGIHAASEALSCHLEAVLSDHLQAVLSNQLEEVLAGQLEEVLASR